MSTGRPRWPFAARLLVVAVTLATLLAAAVVMLVVGRAMPVRAAGLRTRTVSRTLPPRSTVASSTDRGHAGAPIVPRGLTTSPTRRRWTPREHLAHRRVRLAESAAAGDLRRRVRAARRRLVEHRHRRAPTRHHPRSRRGYNRRSLRP